MRSIRTKVPFKSWFWAQVILSVLLSLSFSHTHTHTHTLIHTYTHTLSLSLLCKTNFPHWAEKIAVSQAPHPSCSTLRMIKKWGCAGLHILQLKQGTATLGDSDFRTTGGVSQCPCVFHSGTGFWLPPPALPTPRSCNSSFLLGTYSWSAPVLCLCSLISPWVLWATLQHSSFIIIIYR